MPRRVDGVNSVIHYRKRRRHAIKFNNFLLIFNTDAPESKDIETVFKNLVDDFKNIYTALRDGQTGFKSRSFLGSLNAAHPRQNLLRILDHVQNKPNSRSAKAWDLTQSHNDISNQNVTLTTDIYKYAFKHSIWEVRLRCSGILIYKRRALDEVLAEGEFDLLPLFQLVRPTLNQWLMQYSRTTMCSNALQYTPNRSICPYCIIFYVWR